MLAKFHMIVRRWRCSASQPVRRPREGRDKRPRRRACEALQDAGFVQDDAAELRSVNPVKAIIVNDVNARACNFGAVADYLCVNPKPLSLANVLRTDCQRRKHQDRLVCMPDDLIAPCERHSGLAKACIIKQRGATGAQGELDAVALMIEKRRRQFAPFRQAARFKRDTLARNQFVIGR
ncbi:MAG: hypothetical protein ACK4MV_16370 [Beijerinckiaceae bacterium]